MKFWLGTHHPNWLATSSVPLFVSRNRLANMKTLPVASSEWFLDSGAFTELSRYGRWRTGSSTYVKQVRRFNAEMGKLKWATPQDWMCEDFILKKTGRSLWHHQHMTVINYLALMEQAPEIPWVPVLQGYTRDDYMWCIDHYQRYRVDLGVRPLVGIGSVCKRQATQEVAAIIREIEDMGIRLHAFGLKMEGVSRVGDVLTSADSMAWSFNARRMQKRWCSDGKHKNCANCREYALYWRGRLLSRAAMYGVPPMVQPVLQNSSALPELSSSGARQQTIQWEAEDSLHLLPKEA